MKFKCNNEAAIKNAIELAKTNLENTTDWVSPEHVTNFIDKVFTFLSEGNQSEKE